MTGGFSRSSLVISLGCAKDIESFQETREVKSRPNQFQPLLDHPVILSVLNGAFSPVWIIVESVCCLRMSPQGPTSVAIKKFQSDFAEHRCEEHEAPELPGAVEAGVLGRVYR